MDDVLLDLWQAAAPGLLGWGRGEDGTGIYKYWREHRQRLGSPVGVEHDVEGRPHQAFASGIIIRWDPEGAKEL
jgi:hypothetical protein